MAGWHVHVDRIAAELRTYVSWNYFNWDWTWVSQLSNSKVRKILPSARLVIVSQNCFVVFGSQKVWLASWAASQYGTKFGVVWTVERASIWIILHTWTCSVTVSFIICGQLMLISPRTKARFDWRYPLTLEMALRDHSKDTSLWATAFVTSDRHRSSWALSSRGLR